MKERQAGIKVLQVQFGAGVATTREASHAVPEAHKQQLSPKLKVLPSVPAKTTPFHNRRKSVKPAVQRRVLDGLKRFEAQAERINQLSAELEIAMLELKAISREMKPDWRAVDFGSEVCEYYAAAVPHVGKKQGGAYVLTMQSVDLLKAEREATSIAQELRQRTRRKKSRSSDPTKVVSPLQLKERH